MTHPRTPIGRAHVVRPGYVDGGARVSLHGLAARRETAFFSTLELVRVEVSPRSLHERITTPPWTAGVPWFILGSQHEALS
ncbi:MAG: hypothetical protein IPM54_35375 [Polyangiaceae bacterium]|nr:hypothetical protein [Polyangiaceae bacterium]